MTIDRLVASAADYVGVKPDEVRSRSQRTAVQLAREDGDLRAQTSRLQLARHRQGDEPDALERDACARVGAQGHRQE